ncbi:MAG: DUF3568 family protein [Candidatus Omnitrophota bacterium]
MKNLSYLIAIIICLLSVSGCSAFLIGAGTAGTVGIGMDTMRLERNVNFDRAWHVSIQTLLSKNVDLIEDNKEKGIIKAILDESNITLKIMQLNESGPTAIDITVRKKGLPNLRLADEFVEAINDGFRK